MKEKYLVLKLVAMAMLIAMALAGCEAGVSQGSAKSGQELFLTHCSGCHPNGSNSVYPQKSLDRTTLAANGITDRNGIIAIMRNPGRKMKTFGRDTISDADARKVADYILETFR